MVDHTQNLSTNHEKSMGQGSDSQIDRIIPFGLFRIKIGYSFSKDHNLQFHGSQSLSHSHITSIEDVQRPANSCPADMGQYLVLGATKSQ